MEIIKYHTALFWEFDNSPTPLPNTYLKPFSQLDDHPPAPPIHACEILLCELICVTLCHILLPFY